MVSYHAHHSAVKFLVMATAVNKKHKRTPSRCSRTLNMELKPEGPRNTHGQQEEGSTATASKNDSAVWLGGSMGSIAQRSDLSSSSGSLTLSHGSNSCDTGKDDCTLYDLLSDPSMPPQHSKRQRAGKLKADSVLVISGGQGHRRVNKKFKPQRQEEPVSSAMVWQIPLLHI